MEKKDLLLLLYQPMLGLRLRRHFLHDEVRVLDKLLLGVGVVGVVVQQLMGLMAMLLGME